MRRFFIVTAVLVLVTTAILFGPALYPWTPAAERASRHEPFAADSDLDELSPIRQAYREATDLYRQGRYEEAESRFQAAAQSSSELLRARAAYHRGNCLLGQVRQQGTKIDPNLLSKAEKHYRDCLLLAAEGSRYETLRENARFNLEMTQLLMARSPSRSDSRPGEIKESGQIARSSSSAKPSLSPSVPRALARSDSAEPQPALAGTAAPARSKSNDSTLLNMPSTESRRDSTKSRESAGIMVGPDGVTIRKVEEVPPPSK